MSKYLEEIGAVEEVKFKELQDEYNKLAAEKYYIEIKLEKAIAGIKVMRDGSDAMCLIHARELLDYLEND